MYLSLNNQLTTGRVPWPDFARLAAKVGYKGTDVMEGAAMREGFASTRDLLASLKIRPAITDFPVEFRKDDKTFEESLPKLEPAAQFAAAIGCPRMMTYIMPSSPTPKAELRKIYKERFTRSADILARSHVRLGLEFLGPLHLRKQFPNEFIWRMPEMLEFAKECGSNVGLTLDTWHWHHAGATVQDILDAGKERIVTVHFNDSPNLPPDQIRDNERLMPGEGVINLTGFLQALAKIGYEDALSVEVFGRGLAQMTPEEGARLGLEKGRATLAKAGVRES
ncbi:sugar phosphate isomerase/epimerase family protein [Nevskia soli]|jgi:sugar phosphate isomerase/epimerase|uniref:sugar phosphate isomerase/epimerase family protein n=1 Tax=Nevskia soli TaxID=418856 RepID=UPI0015D76B73|nr:sugar phosphate isomerase/epimerase family protein [Nevskia soli]